VDLLDLAPFELFAPTVSQPSASDGPEVACSPPRKIEINLAASAAFRSRRNFLVAELESAPWAGLSERIHDAHSSDRASSFEETRVGLYLTCAG
jgi:hypothetical protein